MTYSLDDTQPVAAPFQGEPLDLNPTIQPDDDLTPQRGGGCLLSGMIVGLLLLIAVAVVVMAAAAGWTSGQREANSNATATQNAAIDEQMARIPGEVASGNLAMLDVRLRWLATLTPGVPGLDGAIATATALYQAVQATPTLAVTPTPAATEAAAAADAETTENLALTPEASGGYDLAVILGQAQTAAASGQWQEAIDYLDVILGIDPNFEKVTVRSLMSEVLNSYARQLYNASRPAEANVLVERAREFGPLAEGLEYESMAASLYLTARGAVGTGSPAAINALQQVINLGPGRYYAEAQTMLYNFYVTRGDTFVAQGDTCSAVAQYQGAVNLSASGVAYGKLTAAQSACANATPTTDPNLVIPSDGTVAPVGVVAPPGT